MTGKKQKRNSPIPHSTPNNLREVLHQNKICEIKFLDAEKLALSLLNEDRYLALPNFTRHGIDHCKKLEDFVNKIIWRSNKFGDNEFQPNPEEAMYLLSAIWLHDIGMMYQIFQGENAEDLNDKEYVNKIREEHEQRTVKYLHEVWRLNCAWTDNDIERLYLGNICYFHRKKYPIMSFDPITATSEYGYDDIRLAVLASLLRLADGCHVDQSRAPMALMGLYRSVGMNVSHAMHWEKSRLITDVEFDHKERKIKLIANCPRTYEFHGGVFDLEKVVAIIKEDVKEELESVQSVLLSWPNLFFLEVEIHPRRMKSLEYCEKDQYFALWPYLLQDPRSSTEVASAFIEIVLFCLEVKGISWTNEVKSIIEEIKKLRPLDFMVINLCKEIEILLEQKITDDARRTEIRTFLGSFRNNIKSNCQKIIPRTLDLIKPEDILFVFGYSMNIEKILKEISTRVRVIVIDCFEPVSAPFLESENDKIIKSILASGLKREDVQFIQIYSFPHVLSTLTKGIDDKKVTLLLGTHGVLEEQNLLGKVGSELLARTAKDYGAKVIAFAEQYKFLSSNISEDERRIIKESIMKEDIKKHRGFDMNYIEPKMDIVTHDLVDVLITETQNVILKQ
jgi:translation initiation factor 2B subunit (eIF-2B alpha/beta/delta family)